MIFKNRNKDTWDGIEKAATMGTNFVAHTVVGLVMGYYCDKWFHTEPWGLIFWLLMGIVAGFRHMYRDAMKMERSQTVGAAASSKAAGDSPAATDAKATEGNATEEKAAQPGQDAPERTQGQKPGAGGSGDA
ncbi:AtpZ/AtpI family protein [Fundidesulfovibrio putealis]|uniref:AtpZ/AtpI family protein n=1 Tax=Fundidesulfovibrio putealis TaxID=270496 RepID=UPI000424DD5F|nr:AtpZ/AtpI family protein [Fundidesulfovibrio putealis]